MLETKSLSHPSPSSSNSPRSSSGSLVSCMNDDIAGQYRHRGHQRSQRKQRFVVELDHIYAQKALGSSRRYNVLGIYLNRKDRLAPHLFPMLCVASSLFGRAETTVKQVVVQTPDCGSAALRPYRRCATTA